MTLVDDFTRECLGLVVDTSLTGMRVARELARIAELRNYLPYDTQQQRHRVELKRHPRLAAGAWRRVALHRTRETDASTVSETEEVSSLAALTNRHYFERGLGKRPKKFGLGLGQMKPRSPVLGTEYNDLSVVIGRDVGAARVVNIANDGG